MQHKILGVGVYRIGKYPASYTVSCDKQAPTAEYRLWRNMLQRCYGKERKALSYKDCTVANEFLDFQDFMLWCEKQTGFGREGFQLDKDLLEHDVRGYSPNHCLFIPKEINFSLIQCKRKPRTVVLGVYFEAYTQRYKAQIHYNQKCVNLGRYDTAEEAFAVYKRAKECQLKELANKWRSQIDPRAYEALMNYEVLITD